MRSNRWRLTCAAALLAAGAASADGAASSQGAASLKKDGWALAKDKNGVQVYTREVAG